MRTLLRWTFALVIVLVLSWAPDAHASKAPLSNPLVDQLVTRSLDWWASYGVAPKDTDTGEPCDHIDTYQDNLGPGKLGQAAMPGCWISLDRVLLYRTRPNQSSLTRYERLIVLGEVVAHEIGHAAGLKHSDDDGVMNPCMDDVRHLPPFILPWVADIMGRPVMLSLRRWWSVKSDYALYTGLMNSTPSS